MILKQYHLNLDWEVVQCLIIGFCLGRYAAMRQ